MEYKISAFSKNVVLEAVSSGERIDEAVVLFTSPKILNPFHEISAAEIERSIDYQIKSNLFMIKEILLHFQNTDSDSTLSIVSYQAGTDVLPPLEALASGDLPVLQNHCLHSIRMRSSL